MGTATRAISAIPLERARGRRARPAAERRTSRWVIIGTLLSILAVAAAAGIQLRRDHQQALIQAEQQTSAFTVVASNLIAASIDGIRASIAAGIKSSSGPALVASNPALLNLMLVDSGGALIWDKNGTTGEPRRIGDIGLLSSLKASSAAFVTGRFTDAIYGRTPFAIAFKLQDAPGQALVALIDPAYLTRLLTRAAGDGQSVILADPQTGVVAATQTEPTLVDKAIAALPAAATATTALHYLTDTSGTAFLSATRILPGYDLRFIAIGRAANALSSWYESLPLFTLMIIGPSLLGAALAWALLNQLERASTADSQLRRAEERFELAIAGANGGIWDWDLASGRLFWSGAMNALLGRGRQPRSLSLADASQLVHPDDGPVFDEIATAAREGRAGYDVPFRLRHADGHYVWVRAKGQAYRSSRTDAARLVGIVLDMSDQKEADERVDVAESVLRAAIDNAAESFALWDNDNALVICNRRFLEFYGLDSAKSGELKADIFARARMPGRSSDDDEQPFDALQLDEMGTVELQRAGDRWLLVSERRIGDAGRIAVATDITALKQQEDALSGQTHELSELARKLEAEKARAEEANHSKSEFLANMSHELRTPLNAIIGFSDVMRNQMLGELPPRYVEYATDIHRSGQHLLDLINDVLNMARIDTGKLELDRTAIEASVLVADVVKTIEPKAREAGLKIWVEMPPLPPVDADKRTIKQVLLNLLSNSIKFTLPGGQITVSGRADGEMIALTIRDTGIGIAERDLPRITKPFERIEPATSGKRKGGTGLGLAISKALVSMHGGDLKIESELGAGTIVSFTLPLAHT
ncbi:MAG: PAS domain-containing protein [Alphaproteobacteria bacterium]|nr:PAS domain-containing protein [Alphaproteobacteria bacterium]